MSFTLMPQDMLQHEINHFLDPLSRAEFNGVLKPDERVYKKFPLDYALKHAILTAHKAYHAIVAELNYNLDNVGLGVVDSRGMSFEKKAVKGLRRFFAFFKNPLNSLIFMHKPDLKKQFTSGIAMMAGPRLDLYYYLDEELVAELRAEATHVLATINAIRVVGTSLTLKDHESIY
jgi:hypothetical protein